MALPAWKSELIAFKATLNECWYCEDTAAVCPLDVRKAALCLSCFDQRDAEAAALADHKAIMTAVGTPLSEVDA